MIIPIRTDYRMSRTPWVNYGLIAANALIYFVGYNGNSPLNVANIQGWLLDPVAPQMHQFFTSVFLHAGLLHLVGNMIFLYVFGNALNDRLGHVGYLSFYLAGGVLAGVGYVLMSPQAPVLGASGAISAVTGAYLILFPRVRVTVLVWLLYVLLPFELSSLYFLMFQFAFEMYMAVVYGHAEGVTVAHWAHSSGYLFGIAVAVGLLATRLLPRDAFDLLNLIRTWGRRTRYRRMVAQGYDPFRGHSVARPPAARVQVRTLETQTPDSPQGREYQLRREISESHGRHDLATAAEKYLQLIQVADEAVLSTQQQVDVANQLMSVERYPQAADAYERLLKHYPTYEHAADIHLMLGILYGRYLHQYDRAEESLTRAIDRLHDPKKIDLAKADLQAVRHNRRR